MAWSAGQRYLAEFLGAFALLLFGGGAAVFSSGAVFSFTPADVNSRIVLVSAAFGFTVAGLIYALGDVSGGHFNPAVTISMWLSNRMPARDVVPYILAQIVGGALGIAVVLGIAHGASGSIANAQSIALGSQCFASSYAPASCGFDITSVFLLEFALTFAFVLVIQLVTRSENSSKNLAPLAIGFMLLVANLVAIPVDGASINPIRSFSPALISLVWPSARWAIQESWIFWFAPVLGGVLAGLVGMALRPRSS